MNTLLKTSLLGLALVSTASMAGNFSGPEAGASVTMNGGSTTTQASGQKEDIYGGSSLGFRLHGGYGFDIDKDTVVLAGFDYNATDLSVGKSDGQSLTIKNAWSLSAAPGMLLNDKTLAYVKLSYESGKFNSSFTGLKFDQSVSGFGYGVGLRTEINKTTFLETEIKQVNYSKFTKKIGSTSFDFTTSATVGSVGVVFKF
jgi:opacity protein-like surface antigen